MSAAFNPYDKFKPVRRSAQDGKPQWRTTPENVSKAFPLTCLTAAAITATPGLLAGPFVIVVLIVALAVWLIGMTVLGVPAWWALHRLGLRSPGVFGFTGFVLTAGGTLLWILAARGAGELAVLALILGGVGAFAGWMLHRLAYGAAPTIDIGCFDD